MHLFSGSFRYSVLEHRWTQMLTSSVEEGSTPSARYHHASALLTTHESASGSYGASHNFMLVVGGVTQNGVAMDTWSLNLSSLVWREHKVRIILEKQISEEIYSVLFYSWKIKVCPSSNRVQCCRQWLATLWLYAEILLCCWLEVTLQRTASTTIYWSLTLILETGPLPLTLAHHLQVCEAFCCLKVGT